MMLEEEQQIQLQVQCRDGPTRDRKCTDCLCCVLYLLLLVAVISLSLLANSAEHLSPPQIEQLLKTKGQDMPYLSTQQVIPDILIGLAVATAICILLVLTTYCLPSVSAYLYIPLCLLLMLALGAGFLYRFFGNKLPFLPAQYQQSYVNKYSLLTLVCGVGCMVGFAGSLLVILGKQQRLKFVSASLKLAQLCFWDNCYVFGVSVLLSGVTMAAWFANIQFISFAMAQKEGHEAVDRFLLAYLVIFQALCTHGFLKSYSDFLFQSLSLHWYYNQSRYKHQYYSAFASNLLPSIGLSFRHIGTIAFGSVLAFIPESLSSLLKGCEESCLGCYNLFCYCHKLLCEGLSKYSHLGTIMYGYPFCKATGRVRSIRATAKHTFPELYMIGNFYITLMKIFVILLSLLICYVFIIFSNNFTGNLNLIGPILVTLLASDEIANHFMNTTGLVGDAVYFTYVIDFTCETANFGNLHATHCPTDAYEVIHEAKNSRHPNFG